jgi:uroporphyrin-III C-methyltransferase
MAGKRAGGVRTQQLRINDRLIQLAREGNRVVRLKGGDPLVFGRGGEEALSLAAAGIAFRIVPGISAGIGGTAAAGIPLTHRRLARSVAFATGHDSSGDLADVDWAALSRGSEVLVFYMAQRRIGQIAERLIEAGRGADESVALISNATRADQDIRICTLATAGAGVAGIPAGAATLILVGPTIALRPLLADWKQTEPMTVEIGGTDQRLQAEG